MPREIIGITGESSGSLPTVASPSVVSPIQTWEWEMTREQGQQTVKTVKCSDTKRIETLYRCPRCGGLTLRLVGETCAACDWQKKNSA